MKFRPFLALGLFLGVEAQNTSGGSSGGGAVTSANAGATTTPSPGGGATTTNPPTTQPAPTTATSATGGGGGGSTTAAGDVTVTRTTTVSGQGDGTVTVGTTAFTTITSTIVVTLTNFETTTVTEDAETSTKIVYVTSTQWANMKRAINLAPRTVGPEYFAVVEAIPTETPTVDEAESNIFELIRHRRGNLFKRATITEFVTVTVGSGAGKTVTSAQTKTVISTVSDETTTTSVVTSTEAANAKTTVTVTSTLVITSTAVTTGVVQTATVAPSGSYGPAGTGGAQSDGNNGNKSSSGLSTGAKAGIGAACGVVGLALIGGLLWFCVRKRRNSRNKFDSDDMFGSSEVPVGPAGRTQPAMASQHDRDVAANIISPRPMPPKPSSPEGYRGTAPGDGRAGYAKPGAFGAAYSATSPETVHSRTTTMNTHNTHPDIPEMMSPANTAELANDGGTAKWHETEAAEIDGNQVSSTRGSAPPSNVYEMPAQNYNK